MKMKQQRHLYRTFTKELSRYLVVVRIVHNRIHFKRPRYPHVSLSCAKLGSILPDTAALLAASLALPVAPSAPGRG